LHPRNPRAVQPPGGRRTRDRHQELRHHRITKISGDTYAGEWPREQFRKRSIAYEPAGSGKSDIYVAALPLINSGRVGLLDLRAA
jgi:hypothetical protein